MKSKILIAFSFFLLTVVSCKDSFFDINVNPNLPTEESTTPNLLLPMVLNATAKKMATGYDFAAFWTGYWSRGSSFGSQIPLENYDITTSYQQNQWVNGNTGDVNPLIGWYDILMDANMMEKKGHETGELFYVAIAKVVKSIGFMYLVDMYNNVPYTQALDLAHYLVPAYDKGQDIYNGLLMQLDSARILLAADDLAISDKAAAADIMFGGDPIKWRKLANTQTLKLLIHESEVLSSAPTDVLSKIEADGSGFLMSDETAQVQPGYASNQYQLNPVYSTYYLDQNGTLVDGFNRASTFILNKYQQSDDVRYKYIFREAVSPLDGQLYRGTVFGAKSLASHSSAQESIVAGPGIVDSPTDPLWLFTSIESLFLQAEAAQRGWISGTSPEAAYKLAVEESFNWLGVENSSEVAKDYLDNQAVAKWASHSNKLELIINQKYLALPGINNFEAWVDYRRLGFPTDVPISVNGTVSGRKIPLRLLYPQNEYSYNGANATAEGTINAQTSKIFWDVN